MRVVTGCRYFKLKMVDDGLMGGGVVPLKVADGRGGAEVVCMY